MGLRLLQNWSNKMKKKGFELRSVKLVKLKLSRNENILTECL